MRIGHLLGIGVLATGSVFFTGENISKSYLTKCAGCHHFDGCGMGEKVYSSKIKPRSLLYPGYSLSLKNLRWFLDNNKTHANISVNRRELREIKHTLDYLSQQKEPLH